MNKLTKLMLASALLATSGFAQTVVGINADTIYPVGMTVSMEDGTSYELADGVTLHNYTTIQGPTGEGESAAINLAEGATSATIKNYTDLIEKDDEFAKYEGFEGDYYRTIGEGKIGETVTVASGIEVESIAANAFDAISTLAEGPHTIVFAGSDATAVPLEHAGSEAVTIEHNLANELAGESDLTSKSLTVMGKYNFTGNNTHFNADGTSVDFNDAIVTLGKDSLFKSNINVNGGSVVTISDQNTYPGVMTVTGGRLVLNSADFSFEPGSSLILKKFSLMLDLDAFSKDGHYVWDKDFSIELSGTVMYLNIGLTFNGDGNYIKSCEKYLLLDDFCDVDLSSGVLDFTSLFSNRNDATTEVFGKEGTFTYKEIYDCLSYVMDNPTSFKICEM